eukprot:999370-Pyramimonas_sp.AAC.1
MPRICQKHAPPGLTRLAGVLIQTQEFADVWNDPDKGLHLMVPVMKKCEEKTGDETLVQVRIRKQ